MAISFPCACGKTLEVADVMAGERVRCPACRAVSVAPAAAPVPPPPAEEDAGFDVVDEPAADHEFVVEPAKPRVKAVAAPAEPPAKPKKKKRKRSPVVEEESNRELYERLAAAEARRGRIFRGLAYVVLGAVTTAGAGYILAFHMQDLKESDARAPIGMVVFAIMGLVAVGKGLFSLAFGQMFGDE